MIVSIRVLMDVQRVIGRIPWAIGFPTRASTCDNRCFGTSPPTFSQPTNATPSDSILAYWKQLLDDHESSLPAGTTLTRQPGERHIDPAALRSLVREAMRLHRGRAVGVLPAEASVTFMSVYTHLLGTQAKLPFFHMLCQEFGVQSGSSMLRQQARGWLTRHVRVWKSPGRDTK